MIKFIIICAVFAFTLPSPAAENSSGNIKVIITGCASDGGTVNIAIYNSEKEYSSKKGTPAYKIRAAIRGKSAEAEFQDIPAGEYAIKLYHDENANGEMDRNFIGIPKEDYGFSNDIKGPFGSPAYAKVKFFVSGTVIQKITLGSAGE